MNGYERFLARAPSIDELIGERRDGRARRRCELAVVIPSNKRTKILEKHISKLMGQTLDGFDILVVYGEDDPFIEAPDGASVLHLRRRWDFGSAGAFHAGQRVAVEEGYRKIILADDDCLPESDDILERISGALEKSMATMSKTRFREGEEPQPYVIAQYGGFRREVFEKAGYAFLPFYFGAEDVELKSRIERAGFRFDILDCVVTHPPQEHHLFWKGNKNHYFIRNGCELYWADGWPVRFQLWVFFICFMMGAYFHALGKNDIGNRYIRIPFSISDMKFFREEIAGGQSVSMQPDTGAMGKEFKIPKHPAFLDMDLWHGYLCVHLKKIPADRRANRRIRYASDFLMRCIGSAACFGREIHVPEWESDFFLIPALLSRTTTAVFDGKRYVFTKGRSVIDIMKGIAMVGLAALPSSAVAMLLVLRLAMGGRRKFYEGYGLSENTGSVREMEA